MYELFNELFGFVPKFSEFFDMIYLNELLVQSIKNSIVVKLYKYNNFTCNLVKDYLLVKDKTYVNMPPCLKVNDKIRIESSKIDKKFAEQLDNFISVLTDKFPKEYLTFFYNNINELKIKLKSELDSNLMGVYYIDKNSIWLDRNKKHLIDTLNHELFHMSNSIKVDDISYCGFHQINGKHSIGKGLNEGYTEIMSNRYFDADIYDSAYDFQVDSCLKLEKIIGKDIMEKCYMSADLNGLIEELKKYTSLDNIMNFISKLDFTVKYGSKNLDEFNKEYVDKSKMEVDIFLSFLAIQSKRGKKQELKNSQGFTYKNEECLVGYGLTHEYLRLLNYKYFDDSGWYFRLMDIFEYVIGAEKLEDLLLDGGLEKLVIELSKYYSKEETTKLLYNIDEYYNLNHTLSDIDELCDVQQKIRECLFPGLKKKLISDIRNKYNIDIKENYVGFANNENEILKPSSLDYCYSMLLANKYIGMDEYVPNIVMDVEQIVGKEELEKIYVTDGINGLINSLQKYASSDDVNEFINIMDSDITKLSQEEYSKVFTFCSSCKLAKKNSDNKDNKLYK